MSTSNGESRKTSSVETQQLIDFLRDHLGKDPVIAKAIGYHPTHIKNIYDGKDAADRPGFTLMLRQLAFDTMIDAAKAGALVKKELPLKAISKPRGLTAAEVRNLIREEMSGRQAA